MSEPVTPPAPERGPVGPATSTGLDPQLAGLLCYVLGPVTGLVFFLIEKANRVVRFHAAQALVYSGAAVVLWIVLMIVQFILWRISWALGNLFSMLTLLVALGLVAVWVLLLVKGYSGERWKLPVLGEMAERLAAGAPAA